MKKIQIFALRDDLDKLLKLLQKMSVLEVTEFSTSEEVAGIPQTEAIQAKQLECDLKLAEIAKALGFFNQIVPVKPNMVEQFAGIKTYLTPVEYQQLLTQGDRCLELQQQLQDLESELNRLNSEFTKVEAQKEIFKPWLSLSLPEEALKGTSNVNFLIAEVEATATQIEGFLSSTELPYWFDVVSCQGSLTRLVLAFSRDNQAAFQEVLNRNSVTTINLPSFGSSTAAKFAELEQEISQIDCNRDAIRNKVTELVPERPILQAFYDNYLTEREKIESLNKFVFGSNAVGISGWVLTDMFEQLEAKIAQSGILHVMQEITPDEGEEQPILLENNEMLRPFEYLVDSFSYPTVDEVDPTWAVAPFFFIFFGIALGDAGYGILLAFVCWVFLTKLKLGPVGKKISKMFLFSGIGAILIGILTGSFFSLNGIPFAVFKPLEQPIVFLVIALALGLIQLELGVLIVAWGNLKRGKVLEFLLGQVCWLGFLNGVVLLLVQFMGGLNFGAWLLPMLLISMVGLVVNNMLDKKGVWAKLMAIPGSFFTFYGSIGFFSDVLSYSRLMALGMSGCVMGSIMNQLAAMVFNSAPVVGWIGGALIFLFGHALNMALCVLGAYVHSSRLQYLEFFGKFFEGGGRPFKPLQNKQKYTFLINEREAN